MFITSNYVGNFEIQHGCKALGIPAFGTLWDFVSHYSTREFVTILMLSISNSQVCFQGDSLRPSVYNQVHQFLTSSVVWDAAMNSSILVSHCHACEPSEPRMFFFGSNGIHCARVVVGSIRVTWRYNSRVLPALEFVGGLAPYIIYLCIFWCTFTLSFRFSRSFPMNEYLESASSHIQVMDELHS